MMPALQARQEMGVENMGIIIYLLILGWLAFMGYQTIINSKEGKTKKNVKILLGFLLLLIIVNTFLLRYNSQYRDYLWQSESENRHYVWVISLHAEFVADKVDTFLSSVDELERTGESPDNIHAKWSAVLSQSDDISFSTGRISYEHMGELAQDWRDLEFILSRLNNTLFSLNRTFLERGSYSLTAMEREKTEAVVRAYRIIHEGVKVQRGIKFEKGLIESLEEPMLTVDPGYIRLSDR